MIIINGFIAFLRLIFVMFMMVVCYVIFLIGLLWHRDAPLQWGMRMQRMYIHVVLFILQTKIMVVGDIPRTTGLYVSNHRSLLDPVIILRDIDARTVAKAEVRSYPILGKAAEHTGVIYVQREDKSSRQAAKDAIIDHLKRDWSILIFPEGTVSDEMTTLPFFKGSFERAVKAGVPVIPIALIYHDRRHHWGSGGLIRHYLQAFGLHTPNVSMHIGAPIEEEHGDRAAELARAWIDRTITEHAPAKD